MCVAAPGRVIWAGDGKARVEINGREQEVVAVSLPGLREGEFVLVSLGMALERIDEEEAAALTLLWRDLAAAMESEYMESEYQEVSHETQ